MVTFLIAFHKTNELIMKKLYFILLLTLSSCVHQKSSDQLMIPVLDVAEDDYPIRKLDIHDIADVEYIPLESSDSTLLGMANIYVSDKYVVTSDDVTGGNIYCFDHSGKLQWKFNKRGSGPGEFDYLNLVIVDFEQEECCVYDMFKSLMFVYSFRGECKRSMSLAAPGEGLETMVAYTQIRNYDKDYLLGYDYNAAYFLRELPDRPPYYLINKESGTRYPLDLKIRNGLTDQIFNNQGERIGALTYFPLLQNGDEYWITELSSDTIYSLVNRQLIPIAVQTPSIHSTNPPLDIFPYGFTDYFFSFDVAPLTLDEENHRKPKHSKSLVWNRLANKLERWELYNSDFMSSDYSFPIPVFNYGGLMKNCGMVFYGPEGLINNYEKGLLKGRLKEIASTLKEDDNKVIMLIRYNKEKIWKNLTE